MNSNNISFKKVVFIGLGYIGLPSAAVIASRGINVVGVDNNPYVVETINSGKVHIKEPSLENLVKKQVFDKNLTASSKPDVADAFVVAVPTPFDKKMKPDLSMVMSATESAIPHLNEGNLFIIESTCPVGTTEEVAELIFSKRPELKGKISVSYCPERVLPGNIIYEIVNNDRIVGGLDNHSTSVAKSFYETFVKGHIHETNSRTAELCKLTENSYRDLQIAFANEMSILSDDLDVNVWELINLANKHPRVNILNPGCGVGGHCIAVDPWFLISSYPKSTNLIRDARILNDNKSNWCVIKASKVINSLAQESKKKITVACMGLSFKPDIDDLRESPALKISKELSKLEDAEILFVEPNIENAENIVLTDSIEAYDNADIVLWLVAHSDFNKITKKEDKIEIDFCGITNLKET
tara:strand:+ start:527 stop:1762 length:1236 start_codon:yes stop_codon:yes gene_type:complete